MSDRHTSHQVSLTALGESVASSQGIRRRFRAPRRAVAAIAALLVAGILIPALAIAYLSTGPTSDRNWFWQNQTPQGNSLRAMSWVGLNDGWAVGLSGTVLHTTDGGMTWTVQDSRTQPARDITGVSFATTSRGWLVGLAGTVKTTADGGSTWTTQTAGTAMNLRAVSFADSNVGVAVGDAGASTSTIIYTSDGGGTWRAAATTSTVSLSSVHMSSATTGWAVGGAGTLLRTLDGGATWTIRPTATTAGLSAVAFAPGGTVGYFVGNAALPNWTMYKTVDSGATWTAVSGLGATGAINLFGVDALDANNAIAVGANGAVRRTVDGGATWTNQSQNNMGTTALRAVKLLDATNSYAIGDIGAMFYSRDSGESWFSLLRGSLTTWRATCFVDANTGWAVGGNGSIARTTDAGQTWEHQAGGITTWRAVHFADATHGWVVGDNGQIKHTSNGVDWQAQTSGTTQQLIGVWFTSPTTGVAVGNNGVIIKTTDGGTTWAPKPSGTPATLNGVWFADANTGYVVGTAGRIRKTTDGGETWSASISGTGQNLLTVRGVSPTEVWAAGNTGTLLKTTNGGSSWTPLANGAGTNPIRTVSFADSSTGWIASNYGIVQKTIDGGATWVSQDAGMPTSTLDPAIGIYGGWFVDGTTGYLVGDSSVIRRTLDGGSKWSSLSYGTFSTLNAMMFPDATHGWASGTGGTMMYTEDGGQSWAQQRTGTNNALSGVWMTDALRGWAAGDNGTIRRTENGGQTWTAQTSGVTGNLAAVASWDASHALVGGQGALKYTTDQGSTWTSASVPPTQPVTGLYATDANNAWAVTTRIAGNNYVWHSTDGGDTWVAQPTPANANLWDVYFVDASLGYASGDSGVILKTTNGGATWVRASLPTTLPFYWIRFRDANNGWAVGGGGAIARTNDGGSTWTLQASGTGQSLTAVDFAGTGRGLIVGGGGTIMRSDDLTPPTTTLTVDPIAPNGDNSWYRASLPTLTLSASAPGTTYYGWTSAAGPFSAYGSPFAALEGTRTLYYYSVDASGNAEIAQSATLKSDATSPTIPGGLGATVATSTATITWADSSDAVSGLDRYEVFLDGVYATSSTTTSAVLVGLTASTVYSVTVRAVDVAGNVSESSAPVGFLTDALNLTPYTTVLSADPLSADGANEWYVTTPTVTLAALPMSGNPSIKHSWVGSAGPYTSLSAFSTTFTAPAGANSLYYSTWDNDSVRLPETTQTALFKVDTEAPGAPSVNATATDAESINASWTAVSATPSGIERYDVFVDGLPYSSVSTPQVDIVGLTPLTTYSITVRAVNSAGTTSALSASTDATTPAAPLPLPPAVVLAKAPTGDSVYLNWLPSESTLGAVNYRVWRSSDGVTYTAIATTTAGVNECSYVDTGLGSSTRYWYAVSTIDPRGESSLSDTSSATWAYTAPITTRADRVLGVSATGLDDTVYLSWQDASNPAVVGYVVLRGSASLSTMTTITAIPTTTTAYFDLTALNGEKYYYQVAAVDASGVVGMPSVEAQGNPLAPYPANQPHPHEFGNESGCICHGTHSSTTLEPLVRFPGAEKNTVCRTCHAPVNSFGEFVDPLAQSKHPMGADTTPSEPYSCTTCHVPLIPAGGSMDNLMRVNSSSPCVVVTETPAGNGFCYSCHGPASTLPMGDLTVFETSGHRTVAAPPTGANITCDTCHESHSSRNSSLLKYEGFMVCVQCHTSSASNPAQVDILTKLTLNEGSNTKHPLLPQDQATGARMTCQNCHNTHTTTTSFPLVDPHDPSPSGTWTTPRSDEKAFCFRCHDGQALPTSAETTPWAGPVLARSALTTTSDIQARYTVNVHGFASASGSTTTTAHLRTDMGYAYGDVLECRACHDPHGTSNNDAVLDTVVSANGSKTISGVLTYKIPSGGKDFRFFCNTCHLWDSASHDSRAGTSTVSFPVNCKACHGHSIGTPPGSGF